MEGRPVGRLVEVTSSGFKRSEGAGVEAAAVAAADLSDAVGKRGLAHWDAVRGVYEVQTFDGSTFDAPEECVRLFEPEAAESGGFDLPWPGGVGEQPRRPGEGEAFAYEAAMALRQKGYCVVQMFEFGFVRQDMQQWARERADFTLPFDGLGEAYLGTGSASKIAWLKTDEALSLKEEGPIGFYGRRVDGLRKMLLPLVGEALDIAPWDLGHPTVLRAPMADYERAALSRGSLTDEDVEAGVLEQHLDFVQRRRLSIIYAISGSGHIELKPLDPAGCPLAPVRLPLDEGRVLVFRHDLLGYSYVPRGADCLALQSWLMEAPPCLQLEKMEGASRDMELRAGGPDAGTAALPPERQVHVMAVNCRFPGAADNAKEWWQLLCVCGDAFKEMPIMRWDVNVYYAADIGQFGSEGKSGTKHAGLLEDDTMAAFDNVFFNIEEPLAKLMSPETRLMFEVTTEQLYEAGYDRKTMQGKNIALTVADIGHEQSPLDGYWKEDMCSPHNNAWYFSQTAANFMAWNFGLAGPVQSVDTACSASLVAANLNHSNIRMRNPQRDFNEGISNGLQGCFSPFAFIGLSGAGMLGRCGRSMTFDRSANGYNRGEGVGGLYMKGSDNMAETQNRYACYVASFINQDGRSASLTAPNGPSQQAVMRGAQQNEKLFPEDFSLQECHGTGTALGDPIEVGSVRAIYRKKPTCINVGSGKTHIGHLESVAGSVGLIKTILSLNIMSFPSNCHLRELNAHIEINGFPAYFPVEINDMASDSAFGAVNGFGFGGTNAHADLWAECLRGGHSLVDRRLQEVKLMGRPWETSGQGMLLDSADAVVAKCVRCNGPLCWRCGQANPSAEAAATGRRHRCRLVREEPADYEICSECYQGNYLVGDAPSKAIGDIGVGGSAAQASTAASQAAQGVSIIGSWSSWRMLEPLRVESESVAGTVFVGDVRLGEAGFEQFILVSDEDLEKAFYPVASKAGPSAGVAGPSRAPRGRTWLLDGRRDGVAPGTVYRVRFELGPTRRSMSWSATQQRSPIPPLQHEYFVVGSCTGWEPAPMERRKDKPGAWQYKASFGPRREAEFMFVCDGDPDQMIYPLLNHPDPASLHVPVMGPDCAGDGKFWAAYGEPDEELSLELCVAGGEVLVSVQGAQSKGVSWHSKAGSARDSYFLVGSWNGWSFEYADEMIAEEADVYVATIYLGEDGREEFQIVANRTWEMRLYPESTSVPGRARLCGPEAGGEGRNWLLAGEPGQAIQVRLDLGAGDLKKALSCKAVETQVALE